MIIEGKDLELVSFGLQLAVCEIRNNIAHCPDVNLWAKDIEEMENQIEEFEELLSCVEKKLQRRGIGKLAK